MRFVKDILDVLNIIGMQRGGNNIITLHVSSAGGAAKLSCNGTIYVTHITGGVEQTDIYNNLVQQDTYFQADANTTITIRGNITEFISPYFAYFDAIDLRGCKSLTTLSINGTAITDIDISENTALTVALIANNPALANINVGVLPNLQQFDFSYQSQITTIDISGLVSLQQVHGANTGIATIDLTNNLQLTAAMFESCANLTTIRCRALDSNMAAGIADTIQYNSGNAGTVYCDPADPYYSVIQTAANTYGWTIQTL